MNKNTTKKKSSAQSVQYQPLKEANVPMKAAASYTENCLPGLACGFGCAQSSERQTEKRTYG